MKPAQIGSFDSILQDSENMKFKYDQESSESKMHGEDMILCNQDIFTKLAFSHGLARSTKLGVLENHLEMYLESIQDIPVHMMKGHRPPLTAHQIMKK